MSEEDLLTTNNLKQSVKKFVDIKKDKTIQNDSSLPDQFKDSVHIPSNKFVGDDSIGYDQFQTLSNIDRRRKFKKTFINIDSSNRKLTYSFEKNQIILKSDYSKIIFYKNHDFFYLITEDTHIEQPKIYNEVILFNFTDALVTASGIDKDKIQYENKNNSPILKVKSLIYNNISDVNSENYLNPMAPISVNKTNFYFKDENKFIFNIIKLHIPEKVNKLEISSSYSTESISAFFILNVKQFYSTPSHYKIDLGKTFSNVSNIRLISTEIPNTSYTFNSNNISSNILTHLSFIKSNKQEKVEGMLQHISQNWGCK